MSFNRTQLVESTSSILSVVPEGARKEVMKHPVVGAAALILIIWITFFARWLGDNPDRPSNSSPVASQSHRREGVARPAPLTLTFMIMNSVMLGLIIVSLVGQGERHDTSDVNLLAMNESIKSLIIEVHQNKEYFASRFTQLEIAVLKASGSGKGDSVSETTDMASTQLNSLLLRDIAHARCFCIYVEQAGRDSCACPTPHGRPRPPCICP